MVMILLPKKDDADMFVCPFITKRWLFKDISLVSAMTATDREDIRKLILEAAFHDNDNMRFFGDARIWDARVISTRPARDNFLYRTHWCI